MLTTCGGEHTGSGYQSKGYGIGGRMIQKASRDRQDARGVTHQAGVSKRERAKKVVCVTQCVVNGRKKKTPRQQGYN